MKITAIILFAACMQVSAKGVAQTVTLSKQNVPLVSVFTEIEKQTGFHFLFTYEVVEKAGNVNINLKNATLQEALDKCLQGKQLTYSIAEKTIVIKAKVESPNVASGLALPRPIDITGKVMDADGIPLAGANVKVKSSSLGTTTDAEGVFGLKGVDENAMLEISFVGYVTTTVAVNGRNSVAVSLKTDVQNLNEVVINKGYYTETQRLTVGNVGKVTSKEIEQQPVNNPLLALQGRVPGLFITQSKGLANAGVSVLVQGRNSLASGTDPLYIVDGVPYPGQRLSTSVSGVLGYSGNLANPSSPLSFINPMDIESIEVLKDADATSIYGSRAANGAILITTKKARTGKPKFDLNSQYGWGKMTRRVDMLNTQQYLEMRREGLRNDNFTVSPTDYDINGTWDTTRYTNWQDVFLGGTAKYNNTQLTLSGGSAGTQYSFGGNYSRETTVFPGDFADQKGTIHLHTSSVTPNQKLRFQFSGNYQVDKNELANLDFTDVAVYNQLAPDAPDLYNSDGSLNWAPDASGRSTWSGAYTENPLASLYRTLTVNTTNLIANSVLNYQIIKNLDVKLNLGYTRMDAREAAIFPMISYDPFSWSVGNSLRSAKYANSTISSWLTEPQLNYQKKIGKGTIEVLVGGTVQQQNNSGLVINGSNYTSDLLLKDVKSAATVQIASSLTSTYKYNALFGRVHYNFLDKYLINITGRRDGSSRFGPKNQFHNFGSVGVGWIFSGESFISKNLPFLSFGKIRLSYGTTGSDQIPDYLFMNLLNSNNVQVAYQGITGLDVNRLINPYLQWEETRKLQGGIDLGLVNNRVMITVNFYRNRSSNQLIQYSLPFVTGFNSIQENLSATIQNQGWELSASSNLIKKAFTWTSSFNITLPQNKLVAFPGMANTFYNNYLTIGGPFRIAPTYNNIGVDPATGVYLFGDEHGTASTNPSSVASKNKLDPKFYGGFQNSFNYKGLQLDVLFQFVKRLGSNYFLGNLPGKPFGNQPVTVLQRWQKPGDIAPIEKYFGGGGINTLLAFRNAEQSDITYSDAAYIRLKNLSLSWQLPSTWIKKLHMQTCRVYVQGQNLLTLTNYIGLDPETLSQTALPPLRVIATGVQFSF